MASNDNGSSFALGLVVGGIIGTVIGVLIAPRSGTETRADLAERSEAWRIRAEEMAAQLRERVGPAVEEMRDRVGPAVEGMRDRVGPVVEQVSSRVGRSRGMPQTDAELEPETAPPDTASDESGDGQKPKRKRA